MMTFFIVIHVFACVVLITLVLIQRGRGAGLVESFAGVESMFGTKTSAFLTRTTTIMSVVFFMTCLALAVLSVRQSKSLMRDVHSVKSKAEAVKVETVKPETVKPETVKPEAPKPETAKAPAPAVNLPAEAAKPDAAKVQ
jgi:preprotein translocase subunit SecG